MTVIAWDGKIIAADRQITVGDMKYKSSKMERLGTGDILAWNGTIDAGYNLAEWYKSGADENKFPFSVENEAMADLIVVNTSGAKYYCQSYRPHIVYGPMAWGSGALAAMAVLKLGHSAIKAVEITCEVSNSCGMGVEYFEVNE